MCPARIPPLSFPPVGALVVPPRLSSSLFPLLAAAARQSWLRPQPSSARLSVELPPPVRPSLPESFSTDFPAALTLSATCRFALAFPSHPPRHRPLLPDRAVPGFAPSTFLPLHPSGHNSSPCACPRPSFSS